MDLIQNLGIGFQTALALQNLLYAFMGAVLGTLIGVLPGLGPVATIAMLLPSIYALDATPALIMLAGIYYGAQYGGSTTAILINVPGESASVVTAIDGYQMARKGRAGAALAAAGLGSFFAGSVIPSPRSSCSLASITARNMAARPPPSSSTCRVNPLPP